jgi:Fe2+ or Zn2+ uptake regulation protein
MEAPTTEFSHCSICLQKLEHTALFCAQCSSVTCCWDCYMRHLAIHAESASGAQSNEHSNAR